MTSQAEAAAIRLITKLEAAGFTRNDRESAALMHHREFRLSRLGVVDTVVGVGIEAGTATAAAFTSHDAVTHQGAKDLKSNWPLGLGGSVEMFPVLFADTADSDAIAAAQGQAPKRWAILSAHALVHGDPPQTELFDGKAIWGAAYIKSQRKKLKDFLG